jgi:hypothetical protein
MLLLSVRWSEGRGVEGARWSEGRGIEGARWSGIGANSRASGGREPGAERQGSGAAAWREAAAVAREQAASRVGSLTTQNQISLRLGFRVGGGTPLIPGTLLVSTNVIQRIPKISFMVSADVIQLIPIIFCIGWLTPADTNKARPINTTHTPLF